MKSYITRRLLQLIPVLLGMSIVVFAIIHAIPGDPATVILGDQATPEAVAELKAEMGLDKPITTQYATYVKDIVTGDLGTSLKTKKPISEEITPYLMATVELMIISMVIAIIVGVNAGILAAWRRASWFDYSAMLIALIGVSMPVFWLGLMEQWIFAEKLGWLPSTGRINAREPVEVITGILLLDTTIRGNWPGFVDAFKHLLLPGIALGTIPMAIIARITRSSMLEVLNADYVRTARAKGLSELKILYKHALKNAFAPVLTIIGMLVGLLLGGAVLTETIFGWPGIGRYIYDAIGSRDYPVIQSGILIVSTIFVFVNLFVDLLYAQLDPRIKYR
ncbi:peptide ABC transporter permease [Sporosarcina sp. P13]|uniref:ABC transporter permease n=1 Tax=Sporosarcina sp. P13 TaxID=2048263 RepID=UPI000C173A80|nr:ABC transporter permease [Sporosarcina sp. P13]PIC63616.1 peptide ABC transporter permease [Sporosarcina sp. P13]